METIEIKTEYDEPEMLIYSADSDESLINYEDYCMDEVDQSVPVEQKLLPVASTSAQSRKESEKAVWLEKDCKLLIALYKSEHPKLGKKREVKTKKQLWQRIAEGMAEQGCTYSSYQVEGKWKSLKRSFEKKTFRRKRMGFHKATCPFEKDLSDVFQLEKTASTGKRIEQILSDAGPSSTADGFDESSTSEESSSEESEEPSKGSKKTSTVTEELKKWRKEFAKERQAKNVYRQAKLNAYRERTAALERRMTEKSDILLTLIQSQSKNKGKYN